MYFDDQRRVVEVTTIGQWREDCDKGGLHLGEKKLLDSQWLPALQVDARFQKITLDALKAMGVAEFCWLCPGEQIQQNGVPLSTQPEVPYGGFAYIFAERPWLNCYFPIGAPPEKVLSNDRPLFSPPAIVGQTEDAHVDDTYQPQPESVERGKGHMLRDERRNLLIAQFSMYANT